MRSSITSTKRKSLHAVFMIVACFVGYFFLAQHCLINQKSLINQKKINKVASFTPYIFVLEK